MPTRAIVIGAGWSGLAAARTYLQLHPSADLHILDDDATIGGVWSAARVYPGLFANSPNGLYEFSDLSMVCDSAPALKPIPAEQVHAYLSQYADRFGLLARVKFGRRVVSARRRQGEEGWVVEAKNGEVWECEKLIVASGLHSRPHWPDIPQESGFEGVVMHSKSLGVAHHRLTAADVNDVVIVGGCKSSLEAASLCLAAGKRVHWVVRQSPHGVPLVIVDPDMRPNLVAANNTRLLSILSPSIFCTSGFWYNLLHSKAWMVGNLLYFLFWKLTDMIIIFTAGYHKSDNIKKLKPEGSLFRSPPHVSLVHNTNTAVKALRNRDKNITVYRATPTKLIASGMALDTGEVIKADAVVYATGWHSSLDYFEAHEAAQLGLPVPVSSQEASTSSLWSSLEASSDTAVTTLFPHLAHCPKPDTEPASSQFRLYRQIVSPRLLAAGDRSVAFVGFVSSSQTTPCSELQALWAAAWMEGMLPAVLPDEAAMEADVARVNAWMVRRYGARAQTEPEIILEIQSYFDVLMRDLGLRVERKRRGWLGLAREWCTPYRPGDYRGVVEEFLEKRRTADAGPKSG